ncbi:unnamed protein product [Schistosoma curassoni]|uniref:Protein kinase domain-containing protein n=1 Tax=Schistosoma curassoni TaxID=6186 RepID=A0A183K1X6_9TREM|nr:unnamed protein product [Schistosoma curassoni]
MLSKEARKALIGCEFQGARIIEASFRTKKEGNAVNVIQRYAPTNYSNDEDEGQIYKRLQSIRAKCSGKDSTTLMGYHNAKVPMDNTGYHRTTWTDWEEGTRKATDLQIYVHSTKWS